MAEDIRQLAARWIFRHDQHFKSVPPSSDFEVFAKAVLCCANADGHLHADELDWVLGYFAALGAPQPFIDMLRQYKATDDVVALVAKSPVVKASPRSVVFDAIRACAADGEFHEKERAAVKRLATSLGMSDDDYAALIAAYQDERRATEKRIKLLFPNGSPF